MEHARATSSSTGGYGSRARSSSRGGGGGGNLLWGVDESTSSSQASSDQSVTNKRPGGYGPRAASSSTGGHLLWGAVEDTSGSQDTSGQSNSDRERVKNSKLEGVVQLYETPSSSNEGSGQDHLALPERERSLSPVGKEQEELDLEALALLPLDELNVKLPLDGNRMPSSIGSMKHATGLCTPCYYVQQGKVCNRGSYCRFCHLPHDPTEKRKARPCKAQRLRFRKRMDREKDDREKDDAQTRNLSNTEILSRFQDMKKKKEERAKHKISL